jgi:hypothetical protein
MKEDPEADDSDKRHYVYRDIGSHQRQPLLLTLDFGAVVLNFRRATICHPIAYSIRRLKDNLFERREPLAGIMASHRI